LALFLVILPFHLVVKRLLPGPVGTYWKEALLGFLVLLWILRCLRDRRILLSNSPLDWVVALYLGLLLLRFVLDRSGWTGAWGLYVSVMYLPLFWLVPAVLRIAPGRARLLVALLVAVGSLIALGGLAEFLLDVALWPSDEMTQRQGFPDVYIYGTHLRRVYFTLDSPTALANFLAMLLPLALSLLSLAGRKWTRIAAGTAVALMAACIVVTFSRGIWVATVLSLLLLGGLSGFLQRNRRVFRTALAVLAVIGLTWGLVSILRSGQSAAGGARAVELSTLAYNELQEGGTVQELLDGSPFQGENEAQVWTLVDPVSGEEDTRRVLYMHPPPPGAGELAYRVTVPESGALAFSIAMAPDVWAADDGDGVGFQIAVADLEAPEEDQPTFVRYINPKQNPSDRRWRNFVLDLSSWAGRTVDISFAVSSGPAGDWGFDWAGWAEPRLVTVEPDTFAPAEADNIVLRHTQSILDWTRDETNRDRLAAWSRSLSAWRQAPLWGSGLGSTGVASLRTASEEGFVTESQVLKALVELGVPGLLVLGLLWYQIARFGYRSYRDEEDPIRRLLMLGIFTSLLIAFIEGLVYQNLETKQVNAYFWTVVGITAYLGGQHDG
jgi:hypothetical protein